jgi:hypothetical protein
MRKTLLHEGLLLIALLACLASCKPGVPKEFIQPRQLEDILYDYHVADGMAYAEANYSEINFRRKAYRDAALRKHGVTEAQFDSTLVYYYRHTELLHEIYQRLAKRLNDDAIALGATANELSQFGEAAQGDTATVWRNESAVALMPQPPYNVVSFDLKTDTAYHPGDKIMLDFDAQFIFQDGMKDGVAMLAVTYKNDSTAAQNIRMSTDNHYNVQVFDNERIGIKHIKGFIYLGQGYNTNPSPSLKLMCISNMRLMRMRTQPVSNKKENEDSTGAEPIMQSIPRPMSEMHPNKHPMVEGQARHEEDGPPPPPQPTR